MQASDSWRRAIWRAAALLPMVALVGCAGTSSEARTAPCPPPGPRPSEPLSFAIEGDAARGGRLFLEHCQGCHASDVEHRAPEAPRHAPRLDCPAWLTVVDANYLYHAINRGPGLFGHADAPPLGEHLTPMDVADLVAHLRWIGER